MTDTDTKPGDAELLRKCEEINAAPWCTVSSYWAASNIIALLNRIETLTQERDRFALNIARMVSL